MWKISVYTDDFLPGDIYFERALALLAELGIDYVELRLIDGKNLTNMSNDEVLDVKNKIQKYGMKVGGLGTPIFKCPLRGFDEPLWGSRHGYKKRDNEAGSAYEDHLKLLSRVFEISDILDAVNVRCFAFWRQYLLDDVFDEVVEKLYKAAQMAKVSGHSLVLENEHNMMAGTGVELARILKAVGLPLTGIYDFGNSWRRGGTIFPDDMHALKGLVSHIHIKHESIDIVPGNNTYGDPIKGINEAPEYGGFWRKSYGSWASSDHKINGRLNIDGVDYDIIGERTFVPVTKVLHYDHRPAFKYLRETGYNGLIAIDNSYISPQAEENIRLSIRELKKLIEETWS